MSQMTFIHTAGVRCTYLHARRHAASGPLHGVGVLQLDAVHGVVTAGVFLIAWLVLVVGEGAVSQYEKAFRAEACLWVTNNMMSSITRS